MSPHEEMLMSILHCRRIDLYAKQVVLNPEQESEYRLMQSRYERGELLQYILGNVEFLGLVLKVDKRVLIPRPETELLVDEAILRIKGTFGERKIRILDLGTGSGCIAIGLAAFLPQAEIVAVDVSPIALELAVGNARHNHVSDQIRFVCEDMKHYLELRAPQEGPFDIVISNPPYISQYDLAALPSNVKQEPRLALDGGEDGLRFYRYITSHLKPCLHKDSLVFFEVGDGQAKEVKAMIEETKLFDMIQLVKDFALTERFVVAGRHNAPIKRF